MTTGSQSINSIKTRSSNMELLRTLAMMAIVAYHIVGICVNKQLATNVDMLFCSPKVYNKLFILTVFCTFGFTGNNIFILISGYFMINHVKSLGKPIDLKKTSLKLLLQVGFVALVLALIQSVTCVNIDNKYANYGLHLFNEMNWFVGYYLAVIVIASLYLNEFLYSLDKSRYLAFITALFAIISFSWTNDLLAGFSEHLPTLLLGILMFSIGGYIRRYNPFEKIRTYIFIVIIIAVYALVFLTQHIVSIVSINAHLAENPAEAYWQVITAFPMYSIVHFLLSISVFELFRRISIPHSNIINFLGSATFCVCLFHFSDFVQDIWKLHDWMTPLHNNPILFLIQLLLCTLLTFASGVAVYALYLFTGRLAKKLKPLVYIE